MTEGTARRDAMELIEASERLGAEHRCRRRLGQPGGLAGGAALAAAARRWGCWRRSRSSPASPSDEVDRLRDERLNDLLQAKADPRRRVERVFPETIFAEGAPYRRPLGGHRG